MYTIFDRNGRRFGYCDDKDRAIRIANGLGGTVKTEVFGQTVNVECYFMLAANYEKNCVIGRIPSHEWA